jgi:hypothetical protein
MEVISMDDLARLLAAQAIRNLKAAYFRCMDTKNWPELAELFTKDADFDVRGALEMPKADEEYAKEPTIRGRSAIVEYIRAGLAPLISVHQGHAPEITVDSAVSARAIWPMSDMLVAPEGAPFRVFRGHGHYFETYAPEAGTWRIATLRLRRLYVEMQ